MVGAFVHGRQHQIQIFRKTVSIMCFGSTFRKILLRFHACSLVSSNFIWKLKMVKYFVIDFPFYGQWPWTWAWTQTRISQYNRLQSMDIHNESKREFSLKMASLVVSSISFFCVRAIFLPLLNFPKCSFNWICIIVYIK